MAIKVVGVSESKGNYNGSDYHNVILHTVQDMDNTIGQRVIQEKCKFKNVESVFGARMSAADWQFLIGKEVRCFYDRFGQLQSVSVVSDHGESKK